MNRSPLVLAALTGMLFAAGCTTIRLTDACGLNRGLTYVPWDLRGGCVCGSVPDIDPHPSAEVPVLPGMRMTFRYANLQPQGDNGILPGLSTLQWVVPKSTFAPADYFVLSYLTAASEHQTFNEVPTLLSYASSLSVNGFQKAMDAKVYAPIVRSLRYQLVNAESPSAGLCSTASALRERLSEPARDDFTRLQSSSPLLRFDFPAVGTGASPIPMSFCWSGGAFFNQNVDSPTPPNDSWYSPDPTHQERTYITLEVPVRLGNDLRSTYLPIDQSVATLQDQLGVPVIGIRRSKRFLQPLRTTKSPIEIDLRPQIVGKDGYFTVWFGHWRGWSGTHATTVVLPDAEKKELLFAPGDVVLLDPPHKRFAATDSEEGRP